MILINRTYCTKTIRYIVNIVPMDSNGDSFQYRSDFPVTSTLKHDPLGVPKNQLVPTLRRRLQTISTMDSELRNSTLNNLYYLLDSPYNNRIKKIVFTAFNTINSCSTFVHLINMIPPHLAQVRDSPTKITSDILIYL